MVDLVNTNHVFIELFVKKQNKNIFLTNVWVTFLVLLEGKMCFVKIKLLQYFFRHAFSLQQQEEPVEGRLKAFSILRSAFRVKLLAWRVVLNFLLLEPRFHRGMADFSSLDGCTNLFQKGIWIFNYILQKILNVAFSCFCFSLMLEFT